MTFHILVACALLAAARGGVPFSVMPQFSENQTFYAKPGRDLWVNFMIQGNAATEKVPLLTMNGKEQIKDRYEVSMVPIEFPFVNVSLTVLYADPMTGHYQLIVENDKGDKHLTYNFSYVEVVFQHYQNRELLPTFVAEFGAGLTVKFTVSGLPVSFKMYEGKSGMRPSTFNCTYKRINEVNGTVTMTIPGMVRDSSYKILLINDDGDRIRYRFFYRNKDVPYYINSTNSQNFTGKFGEDLRINFTIVGNPNIIEKRSCLACYLTLNGEEVSPDRYKVYYKKGIFPVGQFFLTITAEVKDGAYELTVNDTTGNKSLVYAFSFKGKKFPFSLDPTFMEDQVFTGRPGVGVHVSFVVGGTPQLEDMYKLTRNGQEVPKDHYNMSCDSGEHYPFRHVSLNIFGVVKDGKYKLKLVNDDGDQSLDYDFSYTNEKVLAFLNADSMDKAYVKKKGSELRINFNVSGLIDPEGFNLTREKSVVPGNLYNVEYIEGNFPNGHITLTLTEKAKTGAYALIIKDLLEAVIVYEFTYEFTNALLNPTSGFGSRLYWVVVALIMGLVVALVIIYVIFYTESRHEELEDGTEHEETSNKDEDWAFHERNSAKAESISKELPVVDEAVNEDDSAHGEQIDGDVDAPQES